MRVIAGTYRSRLLSAPRGMRTRPTSDRLRETLFNILAPRLYGCRFVDLYAGTGAVGIEALSRGAEHVWFAENAEPALAALRQNLSALKIGRGFTLEDRGVGAMLQRLSKLPQPVDLVFLDPPYRHASTLGRELTSALTPILADDARVVAESDRRSPLGLELALVDERRYGDTLIRIHAAR